MPHLMPLAGHRSAWQLPVAVACLAIIGLGTFRLIRPQDNQAGDFRTYYNAALSIRNGTDPYGPTVAWMQGFLPGGELEKYIQPPDGAGQAAGSVDYHQRGQELAGKSHIFLYAPSFAVLLVPLTFLPFQAAAVVWGVSITAFLIGSVYTLLRGVSKAPSTITLLALVALASLMSAVRGELFLGQANLFMMACVCGAVCLRQEERTGPAAVLLGLALVTKPVLLALVFFLIWKREVRFALASLASFVVLLFTPFLWLGSPTLGNLLQIWQFSSSHSNVMNENVAPRGLFDRLFTVNPYAPPIFVAPGLATAFWLLAVAVVLLVTLAIITPQPLRRDGRSQLEIGVMIAAVLLISPLTEPAYHVFLIAPWVTSLVYLSNAGRLGRRGVWLASVLSGLWVLELNWLPSVADLVVRRLGVAGAVADLNLGLTQSLVIAIATFVLQVQVAGLASGRSTPQALVGFVRDLPGVGRQWLTDVTSSISGWRSLAPIDSD